jgi:integrase
MSRRPKGPRLYLRAGRRHARTRQPIPDVYVIRDGAFEQSTGFGPDRAGEAEKALAAYIASKWTPRAPEGEGNGPRDPSRVFVAEVLSLYLLEKAPKAADPSAVAARVKALNTWWGEKRLSDVRRSSCHAYVDHRTQQRLAQMTNAARPRFVTAQGARRELEDLSAAIGYFAAEYPLTVRPKVVLPEKPESPRDALTRAQAARLLMAARGYRLDAQSGRWKRLRDSGPANRAHLRRFILIGLYTGTRPGVIPRLLWQESPSQAWVDLEHGAIYRRGRREKEHRTKRRPVVKLPSRLLAHMRRWQAADERLMARRARDGLPTTNAVVHHGGRHLAGRIRTGFEGCVADAGLPAEITPHWMRHTAATWLMQNGVEPWEAAGYLGMNLKTLIDNYGHHQPDHQVQARTRIGRVR